MERDRQRAGERAAGEGGAGPALEGAAISLAAAEAQIDNGSGAVTGIESLNLAIGDDDLAAAAEAASELRRR